MANFLKDAIGLFGFNGVSFVAIKGYVNKAGEVADYVINVGVEYVKVLYHDLAKVNVLKYTPDFVNPLVAEFGLEIVKVSFEETIAGLEKSIMGENARANATIDAFHYLANGVKVGVDTREFYFFGHLVRKTVIEKGVYKPVKSSAKTLCKNRIRRELKSNNYRLFKFSETTAVKTGGRIVEIAA